MRIGKSIRIRPFLYGIAFAILCAPTAARGDDATVAGQLESRYLADVRPLLVRYCDGCHGAGEAVEADVDFTLLDSWNDARLRPDTWQQVKDMVGDELMPPADAPQPTPDERADIEKWIDDYLTTEAAAQAGDPGPVVLRRLSNAEYAYTLRDLTGVESLDPAREFPVDGAAGEGFTNTGNALVMSPALLTKYLDAAKAVAEHAVLLPNGIRFSPHTTSRDWTDDVVAKIRKFYGRFTEAGGDHLVVQQGVPLDVGMGGQIPLAKYFAATLEERDALAGGSKSIAAVAAERGLSPKYLGTLWTQLHADEPSLWLAGIRDRWRHATPEDAAAIAAQVVGLQKGLFTFASVGLIGRAGGPKQWLEPVSPVATQQEIRLKLPEDTDGGDIVVSLLASDLGDGNEHDFVAFKQPRLVGLGRPDLLLRDVRQAAAELRSRREHMLPRVAAYLLAANEVASGERLADLDAVASKYGVERAYLDNWLRFLGIGIGSATRVEGLLSEKLTKIGQYDFISGWGSEQTPLVLANASDQAVRVPGVMRPRGVCVHPSPTERVGVGWRSPVTAVVQIDANIAVAHAECTNGVTWSLELRRGAARLQLSSGVANQQSEGQVTIERVALREGDFISLLVGALDGNHSCDLTAVDLKVSTTDIGPTPGDPASAKVWDLGADVAGDVLASNPHADRSGNSDVWHFYSEPDRAGANDWTIPNGSLLARWQVASNPAERSRLAGEVQQLFAAGPPADHADPNALLYRQLNSLGGPMFFGCGAGNSSTRIAADDAVSTEESDTMVGLDPAIFGKYPGHAMDAADLCVQAPATITFRLPALLAAGCELVTTAVLADKSDGTVQVHAVVGNAETSSGLQVDEVRVTQSGAQWSSDGREVVSSSPILVAEQGTGRARVEADVAEFRDLFPASLCYTKIVPVDEVVTLVLFHREDEHLRRLMLDEAQAAELDRLWDELHYVSQDALQQVDVLEQVLEYATQDADPKVFEPMREPIAHRAAAFKQRLLETQPIHVQAVVEFAGRAYRRPLTDTEADGLRELYASFRREDIPHEEAIRLMIARVLVAPAFLYRAERPGPGVEPQPVSDWELASRLSYFLWASLPDEELLQLAAANRLNESGVLVAQAKRMLGSAKVRRMATEFACHWLHIHDFDQLDEKSERHFPQFVGLREAMYEESIQFFTHLFIDNGSVLDILSADYAFLNEDLAKHYGIPGVNGPQWRRVDGVKQFSRGGILAQAAILAKQSGASRTSPILRGNWVSEVLLGERLPKPPQGVPPLPDDDSAAEGLTVRQLVEKHVNDPKCAVCHARMDPYGFALENFDAIGRYREMDTGNLPIDSLSRLSDGTSLDGFAGLQSYLVNDRRDAFLRQFSRKLLGYALGRAVQLSDEPLLVEMQTRLKADEYRVAAAVEAIVVSPQFRQIRGRDTDAPTTD